MNMSPRTDCMRDFVRLVALLPLLLSLSLEAEVVFAVASRISSERAFAHISESRFVRGRNDLHAASHCSLDGRQAVLPVQEGAGGVCVGVSADELVAGVCTDKHYD